MAQAALGVSSFFLADHHNALALKAAQATHNGLILSEFAVSGEGGEISDKAFDVMQGARAVFVAGHLGFLPGRQVGIEIVQNLAGFAFQ